MRTRVCFHQNGEGYRGNVQRRAARYEQDDSRGQYPRPRDNQFAQTRPRTPVQPQQAPPAPPPPQPAEEPRREVFRDGGMQYEQPQRPYVPGYMRESYRRGASPEPEELGAPVRQSDYISQQNPYVLMSEKNTDPSPRVKQRVLIVLSIVAAVVLAAAGIGQLIFSAQTQAVFASRAAAEELIVERHPFTYRELIEREAYQNNLHPAFVAAIIFNESSFNPNAESYRGARGLMQMMEDTALWVYNQIGHGTGYSFDLMYDADANVEYGCWYLNYLSEKFGGDPILVAAAFHSGQTNVMNWLSDTSVSTDQRTIALDKMPDGNTKEYVRKVLNSFAIYRRLYYEEVTA